MRVEQSNVPASGLRWSLSAASREFPHSDMTIASRLRDIGELPDSGGLWTTKQIFAALTGGDLPSERRKQIRAATAKTEVETSILKGDYVSRIELENVLGQVADGILQIVKASKLSLEEQNDLRRQLAGIPVLIRNVARRQTRATSRNGDGSRPARARRERKKSEQKTKGVDEPAS